MRYEEVVRLITPSDYERNRVQETKDFLVSAIDKSFSENKDYSHTTIIGSAATGNFLRGYRDIDVLMLFKKFDSENFRIKVKEIHDLKRLNFGERKRIVKDKVNARYRHFNVSIGATIMDGSPQDCLGLDMAQHPSFIRQYLGEVKRSDILLVKQFFENLGIYGAKLGGFTIEQMVCHYGGFEKILEELYNERDIFVDFSTKYNGKISPIVVSYPFCGLDNLAKNVTKDDLSLSRDYAKVVLEYPVQFLEDSRRVVNRAFWAKRATKYKGTEEFGFPDIHLNHRENRIMRKKISLNAPKKILDLGCANGYSTISINRPGNNLVWGIDASHEAIEMAKRLKNQRSYKGIEFLVGEMTKIPFEPGFFDIIYAKRALSNLPSIREQKKAIQEISECLRPGGHFYIFDLFIDGYENINDLREKHGLDTIELPFHCIPLTDSFIKEVSQDGFNITGKEDPTSTYYLMSRVILPRVLKPFGFEAKSNTIANRLFSLMPSFGKIGVNKLYTLVKK